MELCEGKGIFLGLDLDMGPKLRKKSVYGKPFYPNEDEASHQS